VKADCGGGGGRRKNEQNNEGKAQRSVEVTRMLSQFQVTQQRWKGEEEDNRTAEGGKLELVFEVGKICGGVGREKPKKRGY